MRRLELAAADRSDRMRVAVVAACLIAVGIALGTAAPAKADWRMYRANAGRTGFVKGSLPKQLALRCMHRSPHPHPPAWPRSDRMPFDRAFQPVAAEGRAYFGSSVDGGVYALDLSSGRTVWSYRTDAPIRFAPVLWKHLVLAASDDGHLYALHRDDGRVVWKKRGGPNGRYLLGNQRLISKWPARGGPVLVGDTVYFAAGIWPSDGIYLYALDAATGKTLWRNADSGSIYMPQPHGGANARSGVSAQGYLVVSDSRLFVPTGRAVPAAFDRKTGKFEYFHLQKYGHNGGAPTMAIDSMFFNSGLSFDVTSGQRTAKLQSGLLAATRDGLVQAGRDALSVYRWQEQVKPDRKGRPVKSQGLKLLGRAADVATGGELIVVGDEAISGGSGRVDRIDLRTQKIVQSFAVEGTAHGLAVCDNQLIVSTDRGILYAFSREGAANPRSAAAPATRPPSNNERYDALADRILKRSGVRSGFCLDLGCGDGRLAYALAKRSRLRIIAVDEDPEAVAQARALLSRAGVYGSRVLVHQRKLASTGYPRYFANLIVSRRGLEDAQQDPPERELKRLQRPYGGVICRGPAENLRVDKRGALAGSGQWTHQYANAANTLNSGDQLLKGRLGMLWFRDVNLDIPQRHGRAPAPLYERGMLFHQGLNGVVAVDAYNGHEVWRYDVKGLLTAYDGDELMGTAGTGSNFCVAGDSVFVRNGPRCLQIEAATGTLRREIACPPQPDGKPGVWGYIACVDGILFGSVANRSHVVTYRYRATTGDMSRLLTESHSLFAVDVKTGKQLWRYNARDSIRHNAIAIEGGRVYLIDRPLALFDRKKRSKEKTHPFGRLVALQAKTGAVDWVNEREIFGTLLAVSTRRGALLMSYQPTRFRLDSEVGGRMAAFRIDDGKRLWDQSVNYQSRPMINDRTIYAQGGAWDLLTGETRPFDFRRSYGCGILAGSESLMLFRSATLGYYDLQGEKKTHNYGGVRPGCWVNAIPAGGVVLMPDASAGCRCSYLNRAWFALESESQ